MCFDLLFARRTRSQPYNEQTMTTLKAFIKSKPVLFYYILVFAISWVLILVVIGPGGFLGTEGISDALLPLLYIATLAGPSIAGVLSTVLVDGMCGLRELLSGLFRWRVGTRWYAGALLTAPIVLTAVLFALSTSSPEFLPAIITSTDKVSLLLTGIVTGLAVGFFEELGWTGFAAPRLRRRYGILRTGLLMGILWGAWHFPLFSGSAISSGAIPPTLYVAVLLFSWLPPYRVLMVWVYDRTQSLLMIMLMHVPIVLAQFVLVPPTISGTSVLLLELAWAAALWIVVGAILLQRRINPESGVISKPCHK